MAYDAGVLDPPCACFGAQEDPKRGRVGMVRTTVGRLIFNDQVPQDLGFVDREDPEHWLDLEINEICGKKAAGQNHLLLYRQAWFWVSANMLDGIKAQGYHYSTIGSLTVSIYDMTIPRSK